MGGSMQRWKRGPCLEDGRGSVRFVETTVMMANILE